MRDGPTQTRRLARSVGATVFGADVAGYQAARIGYPVELYAKLRKRCAANLGAVLEIGPGTGLATAELLARLGPNALIAVEADRELAAHLTASIPDPRLTVIRSGFEQAELAGPFDLACCAAAFHWLDPEPALAKLLRILRPGGTLALWWNTHRQAGIGDAFADAVTPLIATLPLPPSEGERGHYSLDVDHHRRTMTGAGFVEFEHLLFRRERTLTTQQVHALYASYSYIRTLPRAERAEILGAIVDLAEHRFGGSVPNVTLTALYLATAAPLQSGRSKTRPPTRSSIPTQVKSPPPDPRRSR